MSPPNRRLRRSWQAAVGAVLVGALPVIGAATNRAQAAPHLAQAANSYPADGYTVNVTLRWARDFSCPAGTSFDNCGFRISSPTLARLDGQNDILIGSLDGHVYAVHQSDGSNVPGWPASVPGPIASSPSVAITDGTTPNVFVGVGDDYPRPGGLYSFDASGHLRWYFEPKDHSGQLIPVYSTPAIGDTTGGGVADVNATSDALDQWSLTESGAVVPGWPRWQTDTSFSSPALVDLNGSGTNDIVEGEDDYPIQGGALQAIDGHGHVLWTHTFNDTVDSSPSVGVLGNGRTQIAVGVGDYWSRTLQTHRSDATKVYLFNLDGTVANSWDTGAFTRGSPTLADVLGTGQRDVIEGTWGGGGGAYLPDQSAIGKVWAWNPSTGATLPGFPLSLPDVAGPAGGTQGQIVTADFNGDGAQDLVVPGSGVDIYDVKNHTLMARLLPTYEAQFQNSPLIIDNGNGTVDVIIAGQVTHNQQDPYGSGLMLDYTISTKGGAAASEGANGWPMFRYDGRHTGSTLGPVLAQSICNSANTPGYWEFAGDGGVFSQCSSFYGSMGGQPLNRPIIAAAATPARRGYWEVAGDGGIFTFGDAAFYGSTGSMHLNAPIVGMAPAPDGRGYWLVASDGGIFTFGDAGFYGSTGSMKLNAPIVGMAPAPDGRGYWLVASDGGIFTFGDAGFYGSTGGMKLNKPIVGMAPAPDGRGYWLVASDGGIFTFGDAGFYGSAGGMKLNASIVGMSTSPSGRGYWLVASDGGIFTFGDAPFAGAVGGTPLAAPIIGVSTAR